MPKKHKKIIKAEEIARIKEQINVHNETKKRKTEEYAKTIVGQDEQIEILEVKLEAMEKLKVT